MAFRECAPLVFAHMTYTSIETLRNVIITLLSHYDLDIQNIHNQVYDGPSNMRGEFSEFKLWLVKNVFMFTTFIAKFIICN